MPIEIVPRATNNPLAARATAEPAPIELCTIHHNRKNARSRLTALRTHAALSSMNRQTA